MQQHTETRQEFDSDTIDLAQLLSDLWKHRKWIFLLTMVIAVLVFSINFLTKCGYTSTGFLEAQRNFSEHNAQKRIFANKSTLQHFLQERQLENDPNGQFLLKSLDETFLKKHVQVAMHYTKEELKYLTDSKNPAVPHYSGFAISLMSQSPKTSKARVAILGEFLKDTMLQQDLVAGMRSKAIKVSIRKEEIDNQLIQTKLRLKEARQKLEGLKIIAAKYPSASGQEARQLLSSTADGSRYLSPVAQLVGIESELTDLATQLESLQRQANQNALRRQFYSRANEMNQLHKTGERLFAALQDLRTDMFKDKDLTNDENREVFNDIGLVVAGIQAKDILNSRFTSGPTLPDHRSGPAMTILTALSLLIGFIVACCAVLIGKQFRKNDRSEQFANLENKFMMTHAKSPDFA